MNLPKRSRDVIYLTFLGLLVCVTACTSTRAPKSDTFLGAAVNAHSSAARKHALIRLVAVGKQVKCPKKLWSVVDARDSSGVDALWEMRAQYLFRIDSVHYVHFGLRPWLGDAPDAEHPYGLTLLRVTRFPPKWRRLVIVAEEGINDQEAARLRLPEQSLFDFPIGRQGGT
jgi:hypothetical protein